nr:uncharacterized mitochondrial protein AtMg00810-like [Tanacetum cinerariifolium]
METQKPLLKDDDGEEVDFHMYRSMIGSLMYLTSSRPDIMFAVCACARYQVNQKNLRLHAVKRIFRYLKGRPKLGLCYPKDFPFDLVAYTDSDYARASLDMKSTMGGKAKKSVRLMMDKLFEMELELILLLGWNSSKDEQSLGEDSYKQWSKTNDIDADEDITLVNDQDDAEMFDVNDLHSEEVLLKKKLQIKSAAGKVNVASIATTKELEANIALIETWDDVQAKINADYQMAKRLQAEEQHELTDEEKATLFMQILEKRRKFFAAKRVEDKRNKPPTQAQERKIMCTYLKNMVGEELKEERAKKQKMKDEKEIAELKQLMEIIPDEKK